MYNVLVHVCLCGQSQSVWACVHYTCKQACARVPQYEDINAFLRAKAQQGVAGSGDSKTQPQFSVFPLDLLQEEQPIKLVKMLLIVLRQHSLFCNLFLSIRAFEEYCSPK